MDTWNLEYTILQDLHDKTSVSFKDMLFFYCLKLMEHYKMEAAYRRVTINGRKYRISVNIMTEEE